MLGSASATTENINNQEVFDKATDAAAGGSQRKKKKMKNMNSRRFSDEQIKSLESLFKMENKLEPRKKLEMARELGLHPRQVAIWFQNRRARWKSKQVEQDYTSLKADYDTLSHRFESLKQEKHALLQQLGDLCSQLKEGDKDLESGSENGDTNFELINGKCSSGALMEQDMDEGKHSGKEESELEAVLLHEKASNFELGLGSLFFDHSCSNWWDVWSSNS